MKQLAFCLFSILLIGCKKDTTDQLPKCETICAPETFCTDNLVTWSVKITHPDGTPYKLNKYRTIREEDNKIIDIQSTKSVLEDTAGRNSGVYNIFSDGQMTLTDPCGKTFYFVGYDNDVEVLREQYNFSHNCCHVVLTDGEREIIK